MILENFVLPKTVKKTLYIRVGVASYNCGEINIADYDTSNMPNSPYIVIKTQPITIDLSNAVLWNNGLKYELINQLKEQQEEAIKASNKKVEEIQTQIDALLIDPKKDKRHPRANTIGG